MTPDREQVSAPSYAVREYVMCRVQGHPEGPMTMAECERYIRQTERAGGTGQWLLSVKADHAQQLGPPRPEEDL